MNDNSRASLFSELMLDELGYQGQQRAALRCLAFRAPATPVEHALEREFLTRYDRYDAVATKIRLRHMAEERRDRRMRFLYGLIMVALAVAAMYYLQWVMSGWSQLGQ